MWILVLYVSCIKVLFVSCAMGKRTAGEQEWKHIAPWEAIVLIHLGMTLYRWLVWLVLSGTQRKSVLITRRLCSSH